ncbi:MAG: Cell division ATP-binding protein FtsE [Bacteroidetes bacterium ADurb.Bin035]|jgi:cell division transport system ATP-binding protein|nr:MAG: Cell division ATP-binding protein FtsE [Bacteroidetes bacterium ADurb.Bin035]HCM30014.1 phosphonate ABC transporter ATP-binding protein [Bacteroidales bacterium]HNW21128.1 ATP-binding cassette domain-containing protein [Bacteroidales bacterium]HOJ24887.1 ATP-binding cassette domain-containing protein [Bacteroidales bacterium]HOS19840.1 ATP-binding cassette domain-containing protein [Bacteroidales bacterium]
MKKENKIIENINSDVLVELVNANINIQDRIVLQGVSLRLKKGDFIYLIGKTGSGKSSLLKTLYADQPFNGDKGIVLGYDLKNIKPKQIQELRRKIGIIFQDFQLLIDRNVEKNLEFVLKATGWKDKNQINDKIDEVLEMVGLRDVRKKMPHQLSGGEQQKLVIARALLNDPELILADEPTGNLDLASSKDILDILIKLKNNNRAIIMATHDLLSIQSYPQKTFKCEDGVFAEMV